MIGTIRKHSNLLWWSIIPLTILSFVVYMGSGPAHNGRGANDGGLGSIAGKKVTAQAYQAAQREVYLYYLFHYGTWPDSKEANESADKIERDTYVRMLLLQKAADLGIYVSDSAVVAAANEMLRSIGREGQPVPMDGFIKQVLEPKGFNENDFERFVRHDLTVEQLIQALGLSGELITPQEVASVYERENRELNVQAVFFSASNYLAAVPVTPAAVAQFYTNYLAAYRMPDRVQVSYVEFNVSNYLAAAEQKLSKTNLQDQINAIYLQYGQKAFPKAKTADEAKAEIRESIIRKEAMAEAYRQANDFSSAVYDLTPAKPENLATIAKQQGFPVRVTAPFGRQYGPEEITVPGEFTAKAFELTTDIPFAGPISGPTSFYVIALDKKFPSEIPPFDAIRDRVQHDYQHLTAIRIAQHEGTNFVQKLASQLTGDHTFASVCIAAGFKPEVLPPFSLNTDTLPELGERASINQLKQAAFETPIGKTSNFQSTSDGGFIVFVQSQLPLDQAAMAKALPEFTASYRRARQNEAFNAWLFREANRSLQDTPIYRQQTAAQSTQ